jgi:hypothetical protein
MLHNLTTQSWNYNMWNNVWLETSFLDLFVKTLFDTKQPYIYIIELKIYYQKIKGFKMN